MRARINLGKRKRQQPDASTCSTPVSHPHVAPQLMPYLLTTSPFLPCTRAADSFHWRAVRFFTDVRADYDSMPRAQFLLLDGFYQLVGKSPPWLGTTALSAASYLLSEEADILGGWQDTIAVITVDRNTVISTRMIVDNPLSISTGTLKWELAVHMSRATK